MESYEDEYEEFDPELVCTLIQEELIREQQTWIKQQYDQFFK